MLFVACLSSTDSTCPAPFFTVSDIYPSALVVVSVVDIIFPASSLFCIPYAYSVSFALPLPSGRLTFVSLPSSLYSYVVLFPLPSVSSIRLPLSSYLLDVTMELVASTVNAPFL